jgi:hypothetical protein
LKYPLIQVLLSLWNLLIKKSIPCRLIFNSCPSLLQILFETSEHHSPIIK